MPESAGRELVLLRHAKSAWPEGVPDHDRPLAPRGRRDAPAMGRWLSAAGHVPDLVLCSTACRTRQTWELAQPALGATPPVRFEDQIYEASAARLLDLVRAAPAAAKTVLVIGHAPGIPELALLLAGTAPAVVIEHLRAKFPTAAVAVLELAGRWGRLGPGAARLTGFVTPRDVGSGKPARH